MRADEADIHVLRSEFDDHNKPEIVTFDVKHIVLVSDEINRIEGLLDVSQTVPFRLFGFLVLIVKCHLCLRMNSIVVNNSLSCNNSHCRICLGVQNYHFPFKFPNILQIFVTFMHVSCQKTGNNDELLERKAQKERQHVPPLFGCMEIRVRESVDPQVCISVIS